MDDEVRSVLAAEYSLGLLTGVQRLLAERKQRTDAAFREDVIFWSEGLTDLFDVPPLDPPPELRARLAERIRAETALPLPVQILRGILSREDRDLVIVTLVAKAIILSGLGLAFLVL